MADEETTENETPEETPVEEPTAEAEAEAPVEEPVAETPAEEPVAETPAEEPVAEAPAEEPVAEAPAEEPVAEAEPAAAEPVAAAAPAPQSQPKQKHKRLPRALQPKPEHDRGRRQERRGVVVSDAMDKTIVVKVDTIRSHPRYKKVIRRSVKFHAHDEQNSAKVGDIVRIVETRPLSATKNWRLVEIVEAAK
jgi:small subunit ribosomal protein S17